MTHETPLALDSQAVTFYLQNREYIRRSHRETISAEGELKGGLLEDGNGYMAAKGLIKDESVSSIKQIVELFDCQEHEDLARVRDKAKELVDWVEAEMPNRYYCREIAKVEQLKRLFSSLSGSIGRLRNRVEEALIAAITE